MDGINTKWTLQMFADGGEGAAPAEGTEGAPGENAQQKLTFDELLKDPDYNKEFEKRVNNRSGYAVRKAAREAMAKHSPMYEALARKYGMDVSDPGKIDLDILSEKVLADDDLFEQEAAEMGVTVDGLRKIRTAERQMQEADALRAEQEKERAMAQIMAEGEALKQIYPNFDLDTELQNPQFCKALASLQASGAMNPVRTAFQAMHMDEIMGGAMQYAVQKTKQQVSNSIQSGARRPSENGAQAPAETKIDITNMTREQRAEIRKRVMRGEEITFR